MDGAGHDDALLRWAKGRGIVTHPGLSFYTPTATGRGVRALEDVDPDELLCLVPLEACCGHELWLPESEVDPSVACLASTLRARFGRGVLSCALMLLREFGLGAQSVHAEFLKTIPETYSNLPYLCAEEFRELQGTALELRLKSKAPSLARPHCWREEETRQHFCESIRPFLEQHQDYWRDRSFGSFQRALGAVLSRGFLSQGRGPFMVPFADAFNHATLGTNGCQLEGCAADGLAFVMRQVRHVAQGEETFNTYGPLPSAQLFSSFGFAGDTLNPYDGRNCFNLALRYLKAGPGPRGLLAARCRALPRRQGRRSVKPKPGKPSQIQRAREAVRQALAKLGTSTPRWNAAIQGYRAAERRCLQHAARRKIPGLQRRMISWQSLLRRRKRSPASWKSPRRPKPGGEAGSRKGSDVSADDTEVVVPKAGGSSPKPTDSGRPSPKKDRSRSPKPQGPDLGPRWKDNPRLPALVGKQSTDDLHTPCYVRHAYRVGTVAVGPPYQLREKMDAMSPAWSALRVLDLSIEKADWVRSYSTLVATSIREMNRTVSLPKVGASRPKPRPVLRARSAEGKKDRRTSPGKDTSVERREIDRDMDSTRLLDPKKLGTRKDKKDKKGEEDEDGKKKKKDKKKKDKKDKHQSEGQEEEPEVEEPVEAQESFETMPSVGTWLMSFTEDMLIRRPISVESPTSVAESFYSATFGVEASVADALLSAAFGQLTPEAVEELTDEIIAEQADQETEATTLEMARAAVHHTLQQAAIILAQQEASQSSNAICARAAVALAIQRAADILAGKEDELPVLVPEEAPPSVGPIVHIEPEEAVPQIEPDLEVVESDDSEVETEPEIRFPVKRTPFTNSGATRREVSNFALSLTSSIFRASKLAPGQRHASRSRSPMPVVQELSATLPAARPQQEAASSAAARRDPGRQSPPPRPPPTEPSPRPDRGPKPKLTAVPANEGERF
eukprot:s622_g11.t1